MILQSLAKLYDDLEKQGKISRPGWSKSKVGYALCLNQDGDLLQAVPLVQAEQRGKKSVVVSQSHELPAPVKRSSGILSNFLWDNAGYVLGLDEDPKKGVKKFEAFKELHEKLLSATDHNAACAMRSFLRKWDPLRALDNTIVAQIQADLLKGVNLVFRVNGEYLHEIKAIADIWQDCYDQSEGEKVFCLVSGEEDVLESVHPSVKGVNGAQSSGAALVSFNADAFCSYEKTQGYNAPVGKKAAFAYTTALNYLLADRDNVQHISDASIICWADGAEAQYMDFCAASFFGASQEKSFDENALRNAMKKLSVGERVEELNIDPKKQFYILALSPNAARLSIRFFFQTEFGALVKNVNDHHERCKIVGSSYAIIPLWALLREVANLNSKDKNPSPVLAGSVMRSILEGHRYPTSLLEGVFLRIRAEREITSGRAAIIKAYYLKNKNINCPEEVLTVSLNETSTNIPYTVGRLFAVYEKVQQSASGATSIKDKYFNSVAAMPAHILPVLDRLCQYHLRKLDTGVRIYYEKQIGELKNVLGVENPTRFTLPEQGSFYLGYYHQKEKFYEKKENH